MSRVIIELALLRIDVSELINAASSAASISPRSPERQTYNTDTYYNSYWSHNMKNMIAPLSLKPAKIILRRVN
jgi:hypothetical protein